MSSFSSSFASYYVAAVVVTVNYDNAGDKVCSRILGLVAVDSSRVLNDAFWTDACMDDVEKEKAAVIVYRVSHRLLEGLSKKVIRR